ncbi:protein of unknown function [Taphrina deformans PYCC 5710]|uniref:Non-structural maintenance of chromosomes element 1 homolog n=1 Tax=Taphrina deformans (strain PYCC 5710 / ATCC 11124 / CBS 356.35 / IMI 108563 / JCM 9778 / NBRC 8474) TaxID=1097556 RepID=R4XEW3_TAPDE|nr:protein of unknown function [Taphrina deformans PYCC 5710]|eukprot:CCG84163.1 protein of unknown function [Taphrina deformans PYCC 5710]
MGLSKVLQCLLQTFFAQNALTETNLRAVIAELLHNGDRDEVTRQVIDDTIAEINNDISELDFELRRTVDQTDGRNIWVLCNTTSDHLTQLATSHSQNEIAYFKALLNYIFITNNTRRAETLAVARMDAVREASAVGLSKLSAENALKQFVEESWLQQSAQGYLTLTARTLMELQGYLKETYNENDDDLEAIKSCYACQEFLTMGYRCPNLNCACRFHHKCYETFFHRSLRCPVCQETDWDKSRLHHVGERAALASPGGQEDTISDAESASEADGQHATAQLTGTYGNDVEADDD